MFPEPAFQHGTLPKVGILLVNLGTPRAPTARAVRAYLKEFLSDRRVVELPKAVWWPILHGFVLNTRPAQSARKYAKIWTAEGSPLRVHTERQAELLHACLGEQTSYPLLVDAAMRYGAPSVALKIRELHEQRCDRLLVIPLYPQYSASATGSVMDAVGSALAQLRDVPALRVVKHFHDHPAYIRALAQSIARYWGECGRPDKLVMSFHGVPRVALERGDPYHCECHKTARLLAAALELQPDRYVVSFQSRFGRQEWLKPYTMDIMRQLGAKRLERVDAVCPGFVSDCLETLEEIAIENKAAFLRAGGKAFHYIPCLNEDDAWLSALTHLTLENLQGWISPDWNPESAARVAEATRLRARALGARL